MRRAGAVSAKVQTESAGEGQGDPPVAEDPALRFCSSCGGVPNDRPTLELCAHCRPQRILSQLQEFIERNQGNPLLPFHLAELDELLGGRICPPDEWERMLERAPRLGLAYQEVRAVLEGGVSEPAFRQALGRREGWVQIATRVSRSFRYSDIREAIDALRELDEARRLMGWGADTPVVEPGWARAPLWMVAVPMLVGFLMVNSGLGDGPSGTGQGWFLVGAGAAMMVTSATWALFHRLSRPTPLQRPELARDLQARLGVAEQRLRALEGSTFRAFLG